MPVLCHCLDPTYTLVCNNATWAVGEIAVKFGKFVCVCVCVCVCVMCVCHVLRIVSCGYFQIYVTLFLTPI